ncbi:unnamed protein product [Schistosoma mattheei]|uniref:Uncharacterized protein n=1 Tax=Schistosoma mattheei TaxID=31246 RepID=A0A183Q232_9TREM|nr:unnamed protein product [Schistosoma mattheei]
MTIVHRIVRPSPRRNRRTRHMVESRSPGAPFITDYDIRREYAANQINDISTRLGTVSDMTLSREKYRLLGTLPMEPSTETARNASRFLLLVKELQCEFSFNRINRRGVCCQTERPNLDLGLDMLEKLIKMDIHITGVSNVSNSSLETPILAKRVG